MNRILFGFVLPAALACQSGSSPASKPPVPVEKPVASAEPLANPPARSTSEGAFPPSALTDLANGVKGIVVAALEQRPPPDRPIPIERIRDPNGLVRSKGPVPPTSELDFFMFLMEIDILFTEPQPPAATTAEAPNNGVRTMAFLSRTGLKVASIEPGGPSRGDSVPGWLAGIQIYARDVHAHLKSGRIASLVVGESERSVINHDAMFRELMEEQPKPAEVREMEALAKKTTAPVGVKADDIVLAARHRGTDDIYGFKLDLDEDDGEVVLDSAPLVRVELYEPKRARALEMPSKVPPPAPPPPPRRP